MSKIRTRCLIASDTHGFKYNHGKNIPFQPPLPHFDVLLHCGDFTQYGKTADAYSNAIDMFKSIDAELKLVIAGNHELLLDERDENPHKKGEDFASERSKVIEALTAKETGVTYLEEGTHTFKLKNGAALRVYASPFTPLWNKEAVFNYTRDLDRYNTQDQIPTASGITSIATHPIPDFPAADVIMTHGPPQGICDRVGDRNDGGENLRLAVQRGRPLLHCFAHLHPAYGGKLVTWQQDFSGNVGKVFAREETVSNPYPSPVPIPLGDFGDKTCFINAAIMTQHNEPSNAPWLVNLDLEPAEWDSKARRA